MDRLYYRFSDFLKNRYGARVYKLPVNLPVTCPNRDGKLSDKGCIFCGDEGAGFEMLPSNISVAEQLEKNSLFIGDKYKAARFIAYFQNYSNTYLPVAVFGKYMEEACRDNIIALYISTRPDCISDGHLEVLSRLRAEKRVDIVIELGLQTVNYHTLLHLNRGHTLAEFIDSIIRIKQAGLESCAHYIVDLPMDTILDTIEGAKVISALGIDQVKCHSLFILENTLLGERYKAGEVVPVTADQYIERTIAFLEHLDPGIVVQRLLGRAPSDRTLFCNSGMSWWKLRDMIEERMLESRSYQGRLFKYLKGEGCLGGCRS